VHLLGFIIKKFVTMHGNMNVKYACHVSINFDFLAKFSKIKLKY